MVSFRHGQKKTPNRCGGEGPKSALLFRDGPDPRGVQRPPRRSRTAQFPRAGPREPTPPPPTVGLLRGTPGAQTRSGKPRGALQSPQMGIAGGSTPGDPVSGPIPAAPEGSAFSLSIGGRRTRKGHKNRAGFVKGPTAQKRLLAAGGTGTVRTGVPVFRWGKNRGGVRAGHFPLSDPRRHGRSFVTDTVHGATFTP